MSIVSVVEIYEQREGTDGVTSLGADTRLFKVRTSDPHDDSSIVLYAEDPDTDVAIPLAREPHPTRIGLVRLDATCRCDADDGKGWVVQCPYGDADPQVIPWNRAPVYSGGQQKYEVIVDELDPSIGQGGEGDFAEWTLLVNTAGDAFDPPPTRTASMPTVTAQINLQTFAKVNDYLEMLDTVNERPFFGWPEYSVLLDAAPWGQANEVVDGNKVTYYTLALTWVFNNKPKNWKYRAINAGYREKRDGKLMRIRDAHGAEVSSPWPLKADGTKGNPASDPPLWFTWKLIPTSDFCIYTYAPPVYRC